MITFIALPVIVSLLVVFRKFWSIFGRYYTSPLRHLPGPKSPSILYGYFREVSKASGVELFESWAAKYGKTYMYHELANIPWLFTMDTRAVNYVLSHPDTYYKPDASKLGLQRVLGHGLLVVEGEKHRQQRRIMNPAFGPAQLRGLIPVFNQKALELRDVLLSQVATNEVSVRVDVLAWLSRATLDIIGLAGFGYSFDALSSFDSELGRAFHDLFRGGPTNPTTTTLFAWFPLLPYFVSDSRKKILDRAQTAMKRIGQQLLQERKAAFLDSGASAEVGKDVLSLMVKANMESKEGMSDDDILAQVPTFMVAGHETTSTATTWTLYVLSLNPDMQSKLREELWSLDTETPDMEDFKSLTYLDCVLKEVMRLYAPVTDTERMAVNDDMIPLEDGGSIRISAGDRIKIPILEMNRSREIWGEDAFEFKPERWESLPDRVSSMPGIWSHTLSFLSGPRACIGFQFSIIEMKCLLFTLIRSFEFSLAVPKEDIYVRLATVQRPGVVGKEAEGPQLPLVLKVHSRN